MLQTIADALDATAHGRRLLLSISGEPGIGKSHLAGRGTAPRPRPRFPDVALLQRAASDHPLAILVDDIHWADPASLDLLAYLALSLADHDCLIVATDRGDPVESVRRFRALLRRTERVVDIRLGPLHPDEVADLVVGNLGGEPPAPLLEMLGRRAHGMALYVTSLVASLRSQGRLFDNGGLCVLGSGPDAGLPTGLTAIRRRRSRIARCRPGYPLVTFRSKRGEGWADTEPVTHDCPVRPTGGPTVREGGGSERNRRTRGRAAPHRGRGGDRGRR